MSESTESSPVCEAPLRSGPNKGQTATGTDAGYSRHYKAGEPACAACLSAHNAVGRVWYSNHAEQRAVSIRRWREDNPDKQREYAKRYRQVHPDREAARHQRFRDENPDYWREWHKANKESELERTRRWRQENPERARERVRRRRALEQGALVVPIAAGDLDARMSMFGYRCWMCGGPFDHVDHVIPIALGGPHLSSKSPARLSVLQYLQGCSSTRRVSDPSRSPSHPSRKGVHLWPQATI